MGTEEEDRKFMKAVHFGKHRGTPVNQLPIDYLRWMSEKLVGTDFDEYAKLAIEALRSPSIRQEISNAHLESAADEILKRAGYKKSGERRGPKGWL